MPSKKRKPCKNTHIRNPKTGRCVLRDGKIGRKVLGLKPKPRTKKPCRPDQIRNPVTGRCVKKTGAIGRKILADKKKPVRKQRKILAERKQAERKQPKFFDAQKYFLKDKDMGGEKDIPRLSKVKKYIKDTRKIPGDIIYLGNYYQAKHRGRPPFLIVVRADRYKDGVYRWADEEWFFDELFEIIFPYRYGVSKLSMASPGVHNEVINRVMKLARRYEKLNKTKLPITASAIKVYLVWWDTEYINKFTSHHR